MSLFKKERFSIRKICGIVGSVLLGSILVAPSIIHASTYHYIEKSSLTQEEQTKIQAGIPTDNEKTYALIYQQEALPATGSSTSLLTALGLLAVGSLVLLVHKKKKVSSLFLVTTIGLISLSSMQALDISNPLKASSNEGVVQIAGYRYIGYLLLDDDAISEIQHKDEGTKNILAPDKTVIRSIQSEINTSFTQSEKPEIHESIPNEAPKAEKPKNPESVSTVPNETTKSDNPEYTAPVGTVPDEAPKAEKPEYTAPVSGNLVESEVHEQPEYAAPIGGNLVEPEVHEKPAYTKPIGTVPDEAPKVEKTEYTAPVGTGPDEAPKTEKPEYTEPVGATGVDENGNLLEPPVSEKPEYTEPVGTTEVDENGNLLEPPVSEKPAYTEPVGATGVDENGNLLEPPVNYIPEYTEPISTVSEVASEREELPSLHTDIRTETIPKTTIEESDPSKFIGDDSIKQVGEDGERQIVTSYEELHGKKISEAVETVTILKEMKPEILVKGTKEKPKEKTAPVLTLERTDTNVLDRSANLSYHLVNTDGVTINKITATIKDGNEIVKTVDLTSEQLDKQVEDLKFYKDYKIETTVTYDRGKGEETATLEEKPLRLDLKKVELKNIASTNLVKVNDDGTETPSDFMNEKPSEEDVKKMYLKITSRDNKVTRLAVDKIEEVTEEGQKLYKITAEAQDLIQHTDPTKVRNKYVHYIEKPVPKVDDVYYNFKELVDAMNADKNGTFKLGADLNATNVPTPKKWYVDGDFRGTLKSVDGKHYTIHNTERPLFKNIIGGTVTKVNLGNVNINMPWADRIAPIADTIKGGAKIEDVKVTGNVLGKNWVSGFIDKIDNQGTLRNVAFIGNVTSVGDGGQFLTGIVGENWKGVIDKAYVDANIIGNRAQAAGIVYSTQNGGDNHSYSREGILTNSVAKGTLYVKDSLKSGGLVGNNWMLGMIKNNVSMMKVKNGEIAFGHSDIDQDSYYTSERVINTYTVNGISEGNKSYNRSNIIKGISKEEADNRILTYNITANTYEMTELLVDRLNRFVTRDNEYKTTQDYKAEREQAYRNIEKLQPFYNKEWIVNQGNKLTGESNLVKKTVLSVTGMKAGQFVTDLSDIDKIMVHYADGTKEEMNVTAVADSKVKQVREYSIDGLDDVVYTPNMVVKNRDKLIADVKDQLSSVELISQEVRALMDKRDTSRDPSANSDERKNGYIKDLFFEESFAEVKENLGKLVKAIVENEDHQLNSDEVAEKALLKKVEDNKAKIILALTYLNRYYGIDYDGLNFKYLMMFKPDFYGKTPSILDFLIRIGSAEKNLKGDRSLEAYREVIGGTIGKGELNGLLGYNMRLFTKYTDLNDWFIHAAKNVYVSEPETTTEDFKDKRHRIYDGLNNDVHSRMILPLLNLKKAHIFVISTYNTLAFSSFEKYGKNTEEERKELKKRIDEVAKAQQTYLDFWSRLALPSVRNKLLKSEYMVPTPVWDNQSYAGIKDANRQGYGQGGAVVSPIRELFGPTNRWHQVNGAMGAMAKIYDIPWKDEQVYFMVTNMLDQFGISAFTHETTHINDRVAYFGGHNHRQGTDLEAFAQGMLQTPDKSTTNGEYGALGINMAYHRQNDGKQWYNYNPDKLQTREDIDRYMKNYNEALMMLDYVEADAVIPKLNGDNSKWFKKIDREIRQPMDRNKLSGPHQWDKVRDLTDAEKMTKLETIDDLVNNNFMTIHGNPGNKVFHPEDFGTAYVNVNMMAGIYGGNTSQGAPGSLSFKHNAFRMWGYFGYEKGFIGYVSSKYQGEANRENNKLLGDDFIIKKVSGDKFKTLEEWKKQYFKDVKSKAEKGFETIEIDGKQITNYTQLKDIFVKAVEEDLKKPDDFSHTVALKSKVFKALLKNTDGFFNQLFKKDI